MKKISNVLSKRWFISILLLIFLTPQSVKVHAQEQRLSFQLKAATLKQIINEIKKHSDYDFVYKDVNLQNVAPREVSFRSATIGEILNDCLKDTDLTFDINGNTIIIKKQAKSSQSRSLTGIVTDTRSTALPGVTIMIKGTTLGTTSNENGRFRLTLPTSDNLILIFSFIGMKTQEVTINSQQEIQVSLQEETAVLEDVIVTGIFNKSKESYTGAVTSVSAKDLKIFRGQNLLETLKNIDPAFNILQDNAAGSNPNRLPDVNIRGNSSLPLSVQELNDNANSRLNVPLVIMDGFEISLQKLMDFNDEEITNINILKDAAATAIYGSRGANGVIVVNTRAPEPGRLKIYAQAGINLEMPDLSSYDLLNAREKLALEKSVGLYSNDDYAQNQLLRKEYNEKLAEILRGVDTYWLGEPVHTGVGQKYNLRLEGGGESFRWGANLSYNNIKGAMKGSERNTFSGTITLSYMYKNLIFKNQTTTDFNKAVESPYGEFSTYASMNPYWRTKDENGDYYKTYPSIGKSFDIQNPLYDAHLNTLDRKKYTNIINNFSIEWAIVESLRLKGQIGVIKTFNNSDYYLPPNHSKYSTATWQNEENLFKKGQYTYGTGEDLDIDGNLTLSYSKTFREKHSLYAGIDYSLAQRKTFGYNIAAEGFSGKNHFFANALQYAEGSKPSGSESISRRMGITANVNYTFDRRYYADFSFRVDGSSQFGSKNKFAPFWSAGIGWNLHHEKFLQEQDVINTLKIRASYGETGSQQFAAYQALSTFKYYSDKRYMLWQGAELQGLGNDKLKWQITNEINGGIELGLFNNRLSASVDVYLKKTSNLLSQMDLSLANGFPSYTANVGEVKNTGFEAMLSGYLLRNTQREVIWTLTGKLAFNKNKISRLSEAIKNQNATALSQNAETTQLLYEGYSQNSIYAVPSLGIDPSSGKEIFLDKNGNITPDWNPSARRYYGVAEPKFRGNISSLLSYRNFSVNLSFAYHWGGKQYNQTLLNKVEVNKASLLYNVDKRAFTDRWTKPGDVKFFKGYDNTGTKMSSRFVMRDNAFEFQSASLQYRWNSEFVQQKLQLETVNFAANMSDIFYLSTIKRERGTTYPFARRLSLSVSIMF